MVAQVVLRLLGPTDQLRLVWQVGETLLESMTFDEDPEGTRYNVLLALQEMVTNVLRHAYELDDKKPIEVAFTVHDDAFEVVLRDQGAEFDPLAYDAADLLDLAEMPTEAGGFGIHIAKLVMDEVAYERTDGWNILRMKKLVRATAAAR